MATTKKQTAKKPSSGSTPKSKGIVKKKMQQTMHEFKQHDLKSGRSGKAVKNPKQAIAIGLSEARRSGANVPPSPNAKKAATKKAATKKTASASKAAVKKTAAKTSTKKAPAKKNAPVKKTAAKKSSGSK